MRKLVLLVSVWCWSAPGAPAAEIEPFPTTGEPAYEYRAPCESCHAKPRRPLLQRKEAQSCCQPTSACCPTCGQTWPTSNCCETGGESCRKERRWFKVAKWLCYVPAKTRCEKQPDRCCRPPLYQYFTCCQPPCGGQPPVICGQPTGCRGCQ